MEADFLVDLTALIIPLFATCAIAFVLSLLWFKAVRTELDGQAISLSAKIFGGIFVRGIAWFFAFKFL